MGDEEKKKEEKKKKSKKEDDDATNLISALTCAQLKKLGPSARQGTTHGRTFRPHHRVAVVVEPWDGHRTLVPGTARLILV